jgi:hypothetical protein
LRQAVYHRAFKKRIKRIHYRAVFYALFNRRRINNAEFGIGYGKGTNANK